MGASEYQGTSTCTTPGSKERFYHLFKAIPFKFKVQLVIHEVSNGIIYENEEYKIESQALDHNTPVTGTVHRQANEAHLDGKNPR